VIHASVQWLDKSDQASRLDSLVRDDPPHENVGLLDDLEEMVQRTHVPVLVRNRARRADAYFGGKMGVEHR
jgi:hypothetical protein